MIPPKYAVGQGRQAYINSIPDGLTEDICKCKPTTWPNSRVSKLPHSGLTGITVHTECNRPANLWAYIEECENCERYYVVNKYPDNYLLCSDCG